MMTSLETEPRNRSTSRGRDFVSSGRGGLGNIRPSVSQDRRELSGGPDDFSPTRGREFKVEENRVHSTGRGGAGNIHSPDRHPLREGADPNQDIQTIKEYEEEDADRVRSFGRGGLGNMSSRSRSRGGEQAYAEPVHSTGRGGFGNIQPGTGTGVEEVLRVPGEEVTIHSTGRGGIANITLAPAPPVETVEHKPSQYVSSGRGGAGNISKDASYPEDHAPGEDKERHGLAKILHKVTHPLGGHHHDHTGAAKDDPTSTANDPRGGDGIVTFEERREIL